MLMKRCFLLLVLLIVLQLTTAKWARSRRLNMLNRSSNTIRDDRCRQFKKFTQKVDHFGFVNNDTYEQRYTLNTDHWQSGKPIFFYAGNEGLLLREIEEMRFCFVVVFR